MYLAGVKVGCYKPREIERAGFATQFGGMWKKCGRIAAYGVRNTSWIMSRILSAINWFPIGVTWLGSIKMSESQ